MSQDHSDDVVTADTDQASVGSGTETESLNDISIDANYNAADHNIAAGGVPPGQKCAIECDNGMLWTMMIDEDGIGRVVAKAGTFPPTDPAQIFYWRNIPGPKGWCVIATYCNFIQPQYPYYLSPIFNMVPPPHLTGPLLATFPSPAMDTYFVRTEIAPWIYYLTFPINDPDAKYVSHYEADGSQVVGVGKVTHDNSCIVNVRLIK